MTAPDATATFTVPHDGPGTRTLAVAVTVPDELLADPARWWQIIDRVVALAGDALRGNPVDLEALAGDPVDLATTVLAAVARRHGVPLAEALARRKRAEAAEQVRREAAWIAHRCAGVSLSRIGAALGRRHHSTVLHAVRQVDRQRAEDPVLDGWLRSVWADLTANPRRQAAA